MAFDPRSLERLRQLGRSLPQPLPAPQAPSQPAATARDRRHPVETEQDPAQLFRELMQASHDGTVPPHLLERLKQTEASSQPAPASPAGRTPPAKRPQSDHLSRRKRPQAGTAAEQELYSAFKQLLLEDDG
ncbi:MAG: hypothetical protein R6W06_08725 [Prochlorococcaceae cyanobacterium]